MPKAGEIAKELRRIADALDLNADVDLVQAYLSFHPYEKEPFLAVVKALPKPLKKSIEDAETKWPSLMVQTNSEVVSCYVKIAQNKMCTLVEPAKPAVYDCHPLLSTEEESLLEVE